MELLACARHIVSAIAPFVGMSCASTMARPSLTNLQLIGHVVNLIARTDVGAVRIGVMWL